MFLLMADLLLALQHHRLHTQQTMSWTHKPFRHPFWSIFNSKNIPELDRHWSFRICALTGLFRCRKRTYLCACSQWRRSRALNAAGHGLMTAGLSRRAELGASRCLHCALWAASLLPWGPTVVGQMTGSTWKSGVSLRVCDEAEVGIRFLVFDLNPEC